MLLYYILVLSLPLTQHWLLGGEGDFTVVKYIGIACVAVALLRLATRPSSAKVRIPAVFYAFLAYFAIAVLSYFFHGGVYSQAGSLSSLFSMLIFAVITITLVDSLPRLRSTLLVMVGSVGLASIYVVREWLSNRSILGYRPGAISGDSNYFALCASAGMVVAFHLLSGARERWTKLFIYGCLATSCVAFIMAASRGGFVGLTAGLLFLMIRSGKGLRPLLVAAVLILPLLYVVPNTMIQRIVRPSYGETIAVEARQTTWKAGLRMFAAHPITGVGMGRFKDVVLSYEDPGEPPVLNLAHNTYIETAAELGIFGLVAWLALFVTSFCCVGRIVRYPADYKPALLRDAAIGVQAGLVTAAVGSFFLSASWVRFVWLVLFLPPCISMIEKRSSQTDDAVEPEIRPGMAMRTNERINSFQTDASYVGLSGGRGARSTMAKVLRQEKTLPHSVKESNQTV